MPTKVELAFASAVQKVVADVQKVEKSLESLKGEAKTVSGALDNVAAATEQFGAAGGTVAAGMQVARTAVQATAATVQGATVVLTMLVGAFDAAEKAAQRYGNVKVADQINKMHVSFDNTVGVLLELPVAGKSVLQWMGDAAEGAANLAKLVGVMEIQWKQLTGEIDANTAATLAAKLANDDLANSEENLYEKAKKRNVFAEADKNKFVRINGVDVPVSQLPGRAIGGPVAANQPVLVGERGPEVVQFPRPAYVSPGLSGLSGGGMSLSQTTVVNVQAGAFLGNRADALQLANRLAPQITRANQRAATGGLKR